MSGPTPVSLRWALPIARPVEAVWPVISDTDRFNRVAGLGMVFTEVRGPSGTIRRGELRRFGLTVRWEEQPFTFRAPEFWSLTRIFDNGPVSRLETRARLESAEDGCLLIYELDLFPRSFLFRPVVQADATLSTRPELTRALTQMVNLLEGRPHTYDVPAVPLGGAETRMLADGLDGVEPRALADALRERIERAPLSEQQRLRPLQFAEELGIDPDTAIRGFLDAVRRGVLELRWELICPSCRAPKAGSERFVLRPEAVHCATCDIRYDGSFPDSVDVVFRAARRLREVDTEVACLLSPARTPHVLLHEPLPPDGEISWQITLPEGGCRLDTEPSAGGASLEVRAGVRSDRVTVDLTRAGIRPAVLRVRPGPVTITLRNRTGGTVTAQLERRERPPWTLTAGRLFELPDSRDLLPPDAVAPGLEVTVRSGWVLAVDQIAVDAGATGDWDVEGEAVANGVSLRTFDDLASALDAAEPLDGDLATSCGLAWGPIVALAEGDAQIPSGRTVEAALDVMRAVGAGHVAVAWENAPLVGDGLGERAVLQPGVDGWYHRLRFASSAHAEIERLTAPRPDTDAQITVDGYVVEQEIGRGAMGRVLAARGPDGEEVVVKVLLPDLARDPDHVQRFYNEAHLTRALRHPNIVDVRDYGTLPSGQTYLVMERLRGSELKEAVRAGPIPPERARDIGVGMLRGLHAAHEAGVVHRDIKPANVFLLDDGSVKVIDFGIAQPMEEVDELAARGIVLGSPRYMAPEQVTREPLDGRADLYSAGLVLYECLTGDVPFHGPDALSLARARLREDPRPLHELCADLPVGLEAVVMRALAREPGDRFASADDMANALDAT